MANKRIKRTALVLELNTKMVAADVPTKMCRPEGSKRAQVMAGLLQLDNEKRIVQMNTVHARLHPCRPRFLQGVHESDSAV